MNLVNIVDTHAYIDDHSGIFLHTCSSTSMCVLHTQVRVKLVGILCVFPWGRGSFWEDDDVIILVSAENITVCLPCDAHTVYAMLFCSSLSLRLPPSRPPSLLSTHSQEEQLFGFYVDLLCVVLPRSKLYPKWNTTARSSVSIHLTYVSYIYMLTSSPPHFFFQWLLQWCPVLLHTDRDTAAGGMYIIMGFLWLVRVPVLIVAGYCNGE